MLTLSEYNKTKKLEPVAENDGVLCDDCGVEMLYINPNISTAPIPPMKEVVCPRCLTRKYKIM